jgi:hypothetical protein
MEVNLNTVASRAADAATSLTNSLLTTDNGISEPQYRALIKLLGLLLETQYVERLTNTVRATDGQFYLPEGVIFNPWEGASDDT